MAIFTTPRNAKGRRRKRTRGQALVEFALVIPIFLLVLCGILDFGLHALLADGRDQRLARRRPRVGHRV